MSSLNLQNEPIILGVKFGDFDFRIGDRVITTYGEVGTIESICTCSSCASRGFYEPVWICSDDGSKRDITSYDASTGFSEYYQIGKYRFNKVFNKTLVQNTIADCESTLAKYKKRLSVIEELQKGEKNVSAEK